MGLRRTPPPGMDPPTSSRPTDFPTEYPPELPSSPPIAPSNTARSPKDPSSKPPSPTLPSPKLASPKPPSPKLPHITPRNSLFPTEEADKITPHAGLVSLAKIINRAPTTPQRPTTSGTGALSNRRSVRRTPGAGRLNPLPAKLTARSPHASRAFETRRAATPGRERRKSGRYPTARETPRDLLRALSRQLAPSTAPYEPTPNPTPVPLRKSSLTRDRRASDILFYSDPGHASDSSSDSRELPPAPRLSMNLHELDDDSFRAVEPRFSVPLEEPDHTYQSIEFGRRAASEQPRDRRSSFGIRLSDRFADFVPGAESEVGEETVGEMSVMLGEESESGAGVDGGSIGELDEESERMAFMGEEEEEDVTMREELELDPEDSYFLRLPTVDGALAPEDEPEDSDEQDQDPMLPDYDIQNSPNASENETNLANANANAHPNPKPLTAPKRAKKVLPLSRHGHPLPAFPRTVIKKMAQNFTGGAQISNETLNAIVAASEAFFEQISDDLAAYAGHARRKTIEDVDVVQLLKRQRLITPQTTAFSLAQRHLPRELLQEVRMPLAKKERARAGRLKVPLEPVDEGEEVG